MTGKCIPPFKLIPEPLDIQAKNLPGFKWAPKDIGTRHRLGGSPDFLQFEKGPACPECKEQMIFYAQLDSINDEFMVGDCGMIYVFVCFDCNETQAIIQSF